MVDEKEWNEFILDCKIYKDKVDKIDKLIESHETRIIELEKRNDKTDYQYEQIMKTLDKLINVTIPKLTEEIQSIKEKPAKRYDNIILSAIGAIVGGIVGFVVSKIFS